jgi:hypothetical protein
MTNEEIKAKADDTVRVWLEEPQRIGSTRPSVPAVLDAIAEILEQAESLRS